MEEAQLEAGCLVRAARIDAALTPSAGEWAHRGCEGEAARAETASALDRTAVLREPAHICWEVPLHREGEGYMAMPIGAPSGAEMPGLRPGLEEGAHRDLSKSTIPKKAC